MREPVRDTNLRDLLERRARSHPGRVLAVLEDREIRYGEFDSAVDRVAASLHELGVGRGDRVMCALPNGLEMLYAYFAVAKLGAANVFVDPQYDAPLFGELALSIRPAAYILDDENAAKARRLSLPGARVVAADGLPAEPGETAFAELLQGDPARLPRVPIEPGDPLQYIFTSGTTGLPKACILSHRARLSLSEHVVRLFGAGDKDRFFGCLPNYHGNLFFAILGGLIAGGSFALAGRFHAGRYWDQVRRFQATLLVLHAVPLNILLQAPPRDDDQRHPARGMLTVGGRYPAFVARFGLDAVLVSYGATEIGLTSLAVLSRRAAQHVPASYVGRVRDDHEVRVLTDRATPAAPGETGEIQVRARVPFTIFSGYHGARGSDPGVDRDGWYRTGDRGCIDAEGILHFYGRIGDSVRVKGEFVPVEYLESLVREHPAVEDCAVVGVPSSLGDEDLAVFVQARDGSSLRGEDLVEHLRPRVPRYMVPAIVEFVAQFPRAPATLKIQKNRLRETASAGPPRQRTTSS